MHKSDKSLKRRNLSLLYFLSEEIDISINEIIKFQAEQQTYFPIFYFLHKGKISIKEAIEVINSIETTKKTSKENQIKRLNAREQSFSKISDVEFENFKNLINKKYNLYSKNDKESIFKFINKMDKEKITNNRAKIYEILNSIFKEYGLNDKKMFSDLRKTIRHVDEKLYKILC